MTTAPRVFAALTLAASALLASSCGDGGRKKLYPTRLRVVDAAGKPAGGVTVVFHRLDGADDPRHKPAGTTDASGEVALTTYTQNDGAPAGDYAVTVEWRPPPRSPGEETPDRLKGRFRDPKTSPFKASVKPGKNDLPDIRLP